MLIIKKEKDQEVKRINIKDLINHTPAEVISRFYWDSFKTEDLGMPPLKLEELHEIAYPSGKEDDGKAFDWEENKYNLYNYLIPSVWKFMESWDEDDYRTYDSSADQFFSFSFKDIQDFLEDREKTGKYERIVHGPIDWGEDEYPDCPDYPESHPIYKHASRMLHIEEYVYSVYIDIDKENDWPFDWFISLLLEYHNLIRIEKNNQQLNAIYTGGAC